MAEKDGQERTEEPTEKKKRESRQKGQVARSRELNSAALMIVGGLAFLGMGGNSAMGIAWKRDIESDWGSGRFVVEDIPQNWIHLHF